MHFSIPDSQELYSELTGTTYTGYNIYINGAYHCCLRYKQLHALHEQLRRRCLANLPIFPPKRLLPLTNGQLETRRAALEHYLQVVGQDARLTKSDFLQSFLLSAQLESAMSEGALEGYGGGGGYVTMEVLLMNGYAVPVTGRVSDAAGCLLQKLAQCIQLPAKLVPYFCLFLASPAQAAQQPLRLVRRLMDFESPFISRLHATPPCQLLLRSSHDPQLLDDAVALNLLYVQTVADVEREWVIAGAAARQKLRALQLHGLKQEYLELARELPLFGCLQFEATHVDYPELEEAADTPGSVLVSIGNRELSIRTARGAKIYETKFRVTRMRCWRVTAVHGGPAEQQAQLSFEYLMSKQLLRWISITSGQAMLMSVCLQTMVDELLQQSKEGEVATTPESCSSLESTSASLPTSSQEESEVERTAPVKFLAQRKLGTSTYAAVFFRKEAATAQEAVQNDAFEGIGDDDL